MKRFPRLAPRDWIGLGLVFAGFVLRLRQYLVNRSLWLDEAMLANNILGRDFAGLFHQLDNNQGAPVGFLLLQKTITLMLGDSEYALRLVPFLTGCLALVMMFLLARKISSAFAANLALALFAFSPALIYYSSEVKQYSSDVAIALMLILLFLKINPLDVGRVGGGVSTPALAPGASVQTSSYSTAAVSRPGKDAVLLALTGGLAIWFSHPALFVIGALGLALFIQSVREKDKQKIVALLLIALIWGPQPRCPVLRQPASSRLASILPGFLARRFFAARRHCLLLVVPVPLRPVRRPARPANSLPRQRAFVFIGDDRTHAAGFRALDFFSSSSFSSPSSPPS